VGFVILGQLEAQLPGIDANHRIGLRVVGLGTLKNIETNPVFLEISTVAG